jgi:hypothetical protein
LKITIDRDMLLVELYDMRSFLTEAALQNDEALKAKKKLDEIIQLISNSPASENNSSFPKISFRGTR